MPQGAAEAVQSRDDQGVAGGGAGPGAGRGREGSPPAVSVNARWQPARSRASTWGWGCWSLAGGISVAEQVSHAGGVAEPCGWVGCATLIPDTGSGHVQVPWAASVRKGTLSCRPANALFRHLCADAQQPLAPSWTTSTAFCTAQTTTSPPFTTKVRVLSIWSSQRLGFGQDGGCVALVDPTASDVAVCPATPIRCADIRLPGRG